MYFFIILLL